MGKGRNKNKDRDGCATVNSNPRKKEILDDSDSGSDESVSTHLTFDDDMRSVQGDIDGDDETLLDTLGEHIEHAAHKNVGVRTAALRHLQFGLTSHFLGDFVIKWKSTLVDLATKGIKKTDDEVRIASSLLALLCIQIGEEVSSDIEEALGLLRVIVTDPTRSEAVRAHCALSLVISTYVASDNDEETFNAIKALRQAWSGTRLSATTSHLFSVALSGWAILLQNTDGNTISSALNDQPKVVSYLEAATLETRVVAGEVLAFLYEFADSVRPGFTFPNHNLVIEILSALATDNSRSKTKRDKRVQKFSFRQIHSYVSGGDFPELKIKFSTQENLLLDSCASKLFYDLCTDLLHGGMMHQLRDNELLREIFGLGAPPAEPATKMDKASRMAVHDAASKYRKQQRAKQRDRRAAAF